jgi:hypothetical protein
VAVFELRGTYELIADYKHTIRPIRIEVFRSLEDEQIYRARVWEQSTYNLYPTFANIAPEGGIKNKIFSSDQVNREITLLIAEDPTLITGMECSSEGAFLEYIKDLVAKYEKLLGE